MKHSRIKVLAVAVGLTLGGAAWAAPGMQQLSVENATFGASGDTQKNGVETYLIEFTEPGAMRYGGGEFGLAGTAGLRGEDGKFDVRAPAVESYRRHLNKQRVAHVSAINQELLRTLDVTHRYSLLRNGIAADMSADEAARVAKLPGVKSIKPAGFEHINTYRSWEFLEADKVWTGESTPDGGVNAPQGGNELFGRGNLGNGVVIGILDTGAASAHPSFANQLSCGHNENNPKLVAMDCSSADVDGYCAGPNPEAASGNGHGVHVAGTAGGNIITNQADPAPMIEDGRFLAGIAPCATIYSYKVCQTNSCGGADIAAGIESAIIDGVDVINFSISGGNSPWNDNDRDFLDAVDANIFVAASAGNTRAESPNPVGAVSHLGPWMTTVANSSQDEVLGPHLLVTTPEPVPASIQSIRLNPGSTTDFSLTVDLDGVALAVDPDNLTGCTPAVGDAFAPDFFDGKIAVVPRGDCAFTEKINNAAAAGAITVIIGNNGPGDLNMDTTGAAPVPAFSIDDYLVANDLVDFILAHPGGADSDIIFASGFEEGETAPAEGATGDYLRAMMSSRQGYVLSGSSLRGPTSGLFRDLTKPDITAPGTDIYAPTDAGSGNYQFMSGTSMSGPQVAGAGALIRAVHPSWTPAEVKSALMTTGRIAGFSDDATTPWTPDDVGSGHVNVARAAMAGLTLNETYDNYVAANPQDADPDLEVNELNTPSVRDTFCPEAGCTWTRTVTNRMTSAGTWQTSYQPYLASGLTATVTPASFTLQPGDTQEITITAIPSANSEDMEFGHVFLTESAEQSPQQHITVAVLLEGEAPQPPATVVCVDGVCKLQVDGLEGSFSGLGCANLCPLVWLNQFTPDPADYPITITKVMNVFGTGAGWNAAGDNIDVYVYTDNDDDPSNGATLIGSHKGWAIVNPVNAFATINIDPPIVVSSGEHLLIALTNLPGNTGLRPSAMESTGFYQGTRSWIGDYVGEDPDLGSAGVDLSRNDAGGFGNYLIRAEGTNASGDAVDLSAN